MSRSVLAIAVFALSFANATAQATPILEGEVLDNGVLVGSIQTSTNGFLAFSMSDPSFATIAVNAEGIPIEASPDFISQTTRVTTGTITATDNLQVLLTQTGVTGNGAFNFANTFTSNFLAGGSGVTSDVISNYYDANDAAFGETSLLASVTCTVATSGTCASGITTTPELITGPYSETEVFSATFAPSATQASLQSSSQIVGAAVPEPASFAVLGVALMGLGFAQRRRS